MITNEDLLLKIKQSDSNAYETLYKQNEKMIWFVARKFKKTDIELEDLFGIATIGFVDAVNAFDASKHTKFSSFAIKVMWNKILLYSNRRKYDSTKEISIYESRSTSSGDEYSLLDLMSSDDAPTIDAIVKDEDCYRIKILISKLRPEEINIIQQFYYQNKSQTAIARKIGRSQASVSRRLKKIIQSLKRNYEVEIRAV